MENNYDRLIAAFREFFPNINEDSISFSHVLLALDREDVDFSIVGVMDEMVKIVVAPEESVRSFIWDLNWKLLGQEKGVINALVAALCTEPINE